MPTSPHVFAAVSVRSIMLKVILALTPGLIAYLWFFGPVILVQIAIASCTALACEALMLKIRGKPLALFLGDGSALVTAWLVALTFPPIAPWWLTVLGVAIAIVIAKHLYGGLGQNPFNPAMVAFCAMIIAYPQLMSQWPKADANAFWPMLTAIFAPSREVDAIVMATPLDALRTILRDPEQRATIAGFLGTQASFGNIGGYGWEWIAMGYLLGGLWLIQQRVITWHIPVAFLATLAFIATGASWLDPERHVGASFHLFTGGAMLGAFFILTDPVSSAATPLGKLIYAAGAALLTWIIRSFGAYPDGIAFAVLLMNLCVPLIDMATQPRVFGWRKKS